ncbi:uncharacterized protein LOC133744197 [Rosa rugosa]|uniref:uncharacterized protein LOC133744197 n=1 Tax=Rosa rugosa TaxID=74645 RepID=UPI002B415FCF|nr:uncharacterized protein LOC133744197 [Rosa rugosa]
MRGFREVLGYADLIDLGYFGVPYTWSDSETKLRLDRAVATPTWLELFMHSRVIHLPPKIERTGIALDRWQRATFGDRQKAMLVVRQRLEVIMGLPHSTELQEEKVDLMAQLELLLSQDEAYWSQRAKVAWLKDGDRNTGYFHRKASNRKRKNFVIGLFDNEGTWFEDDV